MEQTRLNRVIFLYDKEVCKDNWSKAVHDILFEFDLLDLQNNNRTIPLDIVKTKLNDKFKTDWEHHCSTKPKLRTYVTFKNDTKVAKHLQCNLPKYERSLISQLRLGVLPLRIETGRYSNLAINDRKCLLCNSNEIENEEHFMFSCNLYNSERQKLENTIGVNFNSLNNTGKFETVFKHPYTLSKYVKSAFIKRRENLYNTS